MNSDLMKKLLQGLPQQNELVDQIGNSPAYEVAPNLDPSIYPSPMAYPEPNMVPIDFSQENEVIKADVVPQPSKINAGLPFTPKNIPLPKLEETPVEAKKPSLADILAGLKKPQGNDDLKNAQASRDDMLTNLLYMKAANTAAQAMVNQKADPDFLKDHMALNENKVTNVKDQTKANIDAEKLGFERSRNAIDENKAVFEMGDKEKENDPASNLSKSFRDFKNKYYEEMGSKVRVGDGLSYADMAKSTGALDQAIMVAYNTKLRNEDRAIARQESAAIKAENKNQGNKEFNAKLGNQFAEQLKPAIKIKENALSLKRTLSDAIKDPSGLKDISAIYQYIKALDADSAVKEGEVQLIQSAIPKFNTISNQVEGQFGGDVKKLTPEARQRLLGIASQYVQAGEAAYDRAYRTKNAIATAMGVPDEYYNPYAKSFEKQAQAEPVKAIRAPEVGADQDFEEFLKKNKGK
jgi:O6-methylguanine-DNA--protein-cysteine methyltransferase